jgi:hypothetical protein
MNRQHFFLFITKELPYLCKNLAVPGVPGGRMLLVKVEKGAEVDAIITDGKVFIVSQYRKLSECAHADMNEPAIELCDECIRLE